jgi:hypothetical protein
VDVPVSVGVQVGVRVSVEVGVGIGVEVNDGVAVDVREAAAGSKITVKLGLGILGLWMKSRFQADVASGVKVSVTESVAISSGTIDLGIIASYKGTGVAVLADSAGYMMPPGPAGGGLTSKKGMTRYRVIFVRPWASVTPKIDPL